MPLSVPPVVASSAQHQENTCNVDNSSINRAGGVEFRKLKGQPNVSTVKTALTAMINRRRGRQVPSCTFTVDDSTRSEASDSSSDDASGHHKKRTGGCLRYRSQESSLKHTYADKKKGTHQRQPEEHRVSFSDATIHTHLITLGDNPACSCGPPITISWKSFDTLTISVDEYDSTKPEPRNKQQMLLPPRVREDWLRDVGFARSHVKEAETIASKIKVQREQSKNDWNNVTNKLVRVIALKKTMLKKKRQSVDAVNAAYRIQQEQEETETAVTTTTSSTTLPSTTTVEASL